MDVTGGVTDGMLLKSFPYVAKLVDRVPLLLKSLETSVISWSISFSFTENDSSSIVALLIF